MKKTVSAIILSLLATFAIAHSSAKLHLQDEVAVFNGYGDCDNFKALVAAVSGGVDNELPRLFREKIGPVPGNHRILGHGWTLNAAIPKKTWEKLLKKYPDKKDEIIEVWATFARTCIAKSEELSGLPRKQANALASIIYDIHLIGDLEPDNKLIEDVLSLEDIVKNFNKDCETLFANKPEYAYAVLIEKKLAYAMQSELPYQEKASLVMDTLLKLKLGSMIYICWSKTLKFEYSVDASVNANATVKARQAVTASTNTVVKATAIASETGKKALYKVTVSGKIHNSGCEYYSSKGELTAEPKGENCGKCGGLK
jgi:hypothetical protein